MSNTYTEQPTNPIEIDWKTISNRAINDLVDEIVGADKFKKKVDWCSDWTATTKLCEEHSIKLEFKVGASVFPIAHHGELVVGDISDNPNLTGTYYIDKNLLRAACIVLIKINS